MGCCFSAHNRIQIQQTFTCDESASLKQTWNLLKTRDIGKFADDILIRFVVLFLCFREKKHFFSKIISRTIDRNSLFRQYWMSRLNVDGNNYDFSQGESCLRTDRNWYIGIREYSVQLLVFFDQLLSVIPNEDLLLTHIRVFRSVQNILIFEHNSLAVNQSAFKVDSNRKFRLFFLR